MGEPGLQGNAAKRLQQRVAERKALLAAGQRLNY